MIEWHIHPMRVEPWYAAWMPAFERAEAYGATATSMTRSEDDPLHFRQTTVWESRGDFDRFWTSDEAARARAEALNYYNKPILPGWHVPCGKP